MSKRTLLRILERERQAHEAERRRLIDQILHLTGKPWTPAPADTTPTVDVEPEPRSWTHSPEQHV